MGITNIKFKDYRFFIDTDGDHYGLEFWTTFESFEWEPDTLNFLEREICDGSYLLDIGAANGSLSLLGAALGAQVVAYEPNPHVYQVCKRNIELNEKYSQKIQLKMAAISNINSQINFVQGINPKIISDISVGQHSDNQTKIPVLSLAEELEGIPASVSKILIKMDIEGAEFAILQDDLSLNSMKKRKVKLLLAIHPGFYRPVSTRLPFFGIRRKFFYFRNYLEAAKIFGEISKVASIKRTNLNPVRSRKIFGLLVIAGYHEFIIDFS